MATQTYYSLALLFLVTTHNIVINTANPTSESKCDCFHSSFTRQIFPPDFVFGAASSAYQFEGAYKENGKGLSLWDDFTHNYPGKIKDHSNGDIAIDSYHLYKEDVKIARNLGLDAYRISISWPRILPGIEPFVTLLHLDIPQALQVAYGGFLDSQIVADFVDFANIVFQNFGDRVKNWITVNEPWTFSVYGYAYGFFAPGRCSAWQQLGCTGGDSATEPYIVAHHQLLAHSNVVNLYRNKYQKGKIGITFASYWFVPLDDTTENRKAKDRAMDFMLGWFMEPLTAGDYPESMKIGVGDRLPQFTENETKMMKGSFDFIGFNYYGAIYALNSPNSSSSSYATDAEIEITGIRDGKKIGEQGRNTSRIYIYPKGLYQILKFFKERYNDPLIYITENGLDETANDMLEVSEAIKDDMRKHYIYDHLCCLHKSIEEYAANVKGYFVWSLMDNFEWAAGFSVRFGLYYVNYRDIVLTRYPKHSALWFKDFLNHNSSKMFQEM
ncbi:hypothetical protein ACS0TY_026701 [Phlomoides rotata]